MLIVKWLLCVSRSGRPGIRSTARAHVAARPSRLGGSLRMTLSDYMMMSCTRRDGASAMISALAAKNSCGLLLT